MKLNYIQFYLYNELVEKGAEIHKEHTDTEIEILQKIVNNLYKEDGSAQKNAQNIN